VRRSWLRFLARYVVATLALTVVLLVLCRCATAPDYVTRHGLEVHDETADRAVLGARAAIEAITDLVIDEYPYGDGRFAFRGVPAVFVDERQGADGFHDCGTHEVTIWRGSWTDCLATSPLGHELTHHLELELHDRCPADHDDAALWGDPERGGGMVARVVARAYESICEL
jgi:hypothetical protein